MNKRFKNKNYLIFFFISLIMFFLVFMVFGLTEDNYLQGDVWDYHMIGKSLFEGTGFSIYNISTDFRGYIFPLFMGICTKVNMDLGISNSLYYVGSIFFAVFITLFLSFMRDILGDRFYVKERLVYLILPVIMLVFFFYGLIIYPLTDLYAALLCIFGTRSIFKAVKADNISRKIIYCSVAGFAMYVSYNIRTIYQISLIAFILYIVIFCGGKIAARIWAVFAYIVGAGIAAIPQVLLNIEKYASISPWINNENLFARQLFWGLQYSRYATYVGDRTVHKPAMYFVDGTGVKLVERAEELGIAESIGGYFELLIHFPLEMISIVFRHIVNAIFIIFPEQYIYELGANRYIYIILSILIVFVFLIVLCSIIRSRLLQLEEYFLFFIMLLPSFAILFGAVEERFLILPYMLIYAIICNFNYQKYIGKLSSMKIIKVILGFSIFALLALTVEGDILSSLNDYPLFFRGA